MERYGILTSNTANPSTPVNVRYQPNGELKITLPTGTRVRILIEPAAPESSGYKWFQIQYGPAIGDAGWVREDVILLEPPPPQPTPPPNEVNTYLYFETNSRLVRVFLERGQLWMNVYHKASNTTEVNAVPAARIPTLDGHRSPWRSYLAQGGTTLFVARCLPRAETQLIRANAIDGSNLGEESGFAATGSAYREG